MHSTIDSDKLLLSSFPLITHLQKKIHEDTFEYLISHINLTKPYPHFEKFQRGQLKRSFPSPNRHLITLPPSRACLQAFGSWRESEGSYSADASEFPPRFRLLLNI